MEYLLSLACVWSNIEKLELILAKTGNTCKATHKDEMTNKMCWRINAVTVVVRKQCSSTYNISCIANVISIGTGLHAANSGEIGWKTSAQR